MPVEGQRTSLVSLSGDAYRLAGNQNQMARFRASWGTSGIFSPGEPLVPPEPEKTRLWDFPVGWNFTYTPRAWEPISFAQLRALADNHDITRLVIETRKDQIEALNWAIKPIDGQRPAPDALPRIAALTRFWRSPDGEQPLAGWLRAVLEDLLVIDAPTLEIRRNRGGEIIGLDVVDGATITLLIDETGRRPNPPTPAFEQVIHGRPWKLLTADDLIYMPRNRRPAKIYGFGPVEQIVMTVNIALRRQLMQLQHFTEGNVPPGLLNAPDNWTAEQIRQFQEWFDAILAGNTGARTRLVWGPAGAKYQAFKEAPYKDEFDEWLARIVCYAFSLPPTPFVQQLNRATAETVQSTALEEGLAPLMGWVKRLIDHVIQDRMGHPDLEFAWSGARPSDPKDEAAILAGYVQNGIYTVNEARAALGLGAVAGGDRAMVYGSAGAVPLAGAGTAAKGLADSAPWIRANFNPDQPRVPAGSQWTNSGDNSEPSLSAPQSGRDVLHPLLRPASEITFDHGARHVTDPEAVEAAIRSALSGAILTPGLNTGMVNVGGTWYIYHAYLLPSGRIHVGTYFPR